MVNKIEQQRIYNLLSEALMSLCKNSLNYNRQFTVEGLLGITLDENEVLLININDKYQMRGQTHDPAYRTAPREIYAPDTASRSSEDVYIRDTSTPTRRRHRDQESPEENLPKRAHIAPGEQKQSGVRVKEEKFSDTELETSQAGAARLTGAPPGGGGQQSSSGDSPVVMVVPEGSQQSLPSATAGRPPSPTPSTEDPSAQGLHLCPHCNQSFTYASALSRHVKSTHQGRRDHQCWMCPKTYVRNEDLRKHLQKVHQLTLTASQLRQHRTLSDMPSTSTGGPHPEQMMMSPSPSVESLNKLDEHARWTQPRSQVVSPGADDSRMTSTTIADTASEMSDTRDTTYMEEHFSTDSLNVDLRAKLQTDSNSGVG